MIGTNNDLVNYHNEIQRWEQEKSILCLLNRSKIKDFYSHNRYLIESISNEIFKISSKYFEMEDDSGSKKIKYTGEGQERAAVLLEDKTFEMFQDELNRFLNKKIEIKF